MTYKDRLEYIIKEETLLSLFLDNSLKSGMTEQVAKEQWKILKQTLNEDNIDEVLLFEQAKAIIRQNRARLGYNNQQVAAVLERTFSSLKQQPVQQAPAQHVVPPEEQVAPPEDVEKASEPDEVEDIELMGV